MKLSELAASRWQTKKDQRIAVAVALAESRGKMDAENHNKDGSVDCGPWQVNSVHGYDCERLKSDPNYSADAAYAVWQSGGWHQWVTYNTGAYVPFLGHDADLTADDPSILKKIGGAIIDTSPIGIITGVSGPNVPNPVSGLEAIGHVMNTLTNPSTYARLGKGFLGGGLIVIGVGSLVFIVANKAASSSAVKTATKVIP